MPITKEQAREALDSLDDFARMAEVTPTGPLNTLLTYLEQLESECATLAEAVTQMQKALKPLAAYAPHYPLVQTYGNRPISGPIHSVVTGRMKEALLAVEDFHAAKN